MAKKPESRKIGRDASTGQFVPVEQAKRHPRTTTVETIKVSAPPKKKT
jgi:hypothetical protein